VAIVVGKDPVGHPPPTVIRTNYSDIASTISGVLANEATTRDNTKYVEWWKTGIRWNEVLTTIFPSSS
jgi:hypothetical protein